VLDVKDENAPVCEVGTQVVVDFVGRQASTRDDEKGPIFHEAKDWLIVVGDKDVVPALEMGIRFLQEGSKGVVYSHSKFAYGNIVRLSGDYQLPPNSNVVYHVHVKKVVNASEVEIAQSRKRIANDCYENEWSDGYGKDRPLYLYKKAADAMNHCLISSPDDETSKSILIDCLNNTAAVHLRAKQYGKAKQAATNVLMHDPDNLKALCRAARAAMLDPAGSYEESDAAIAAAEIVNCDDPDVIKLRVELEHRKKDYKRKSKAMFSKIGASKNKKAESKKNEPQLDTSEDESKTDTVPADERTLFQIYWPYLIQLLLLLVVALVNKRADMRNLQEKMESATEKVDSTTDSGSEF
jgi:predicted Holliday junction resolvase-like endonuclease